MRDQKISDSSESLLFVTISALSQKTIKSEKREQTDYMVIRSCLASTNTLIDGAREKGTFSISLVGCRRELSFPSSNADRQMKIV